MVPAVRRFVRRDNGIGGRLSAEARAVTSVKTGTIDDKIQVDLGCDAPSGSMAPMAEEHGQRPDGRSGVRGRGEGPAGFGSGASAALGWKRKLQEASGTKLGCLAQLGATLGRREGSERRELWAAGNGVETVVNAQAKAATVGVAPIQIGPVGASAA